MATSQLAVEIYKGEKPLGTGSYGSVYKAKIGHRLCAAKLLHSFMLETKECTERFKQECQLLSLIKHPNIVQYLMTYKDPESQNLALMMELMDGSLTQFLENYTDYLPYHIQINICHDVALAMSYLHSCKVIHRDLSSNNVLLIGDGSRAKVTDLGMSKLSDINPDAAKKLTKCPGSQNYMPPEALTENPCYTYKLDCFSYGVLIIQVITKLLPSPPFIAVPEWQRRKNHIDLVEPDHPLKPLALQCLADNEAERPSADEICEKFENLSLDGKYKPPDVIKSQKELDESDLRVQLHQMQRNIHKVQNDCRIQLQHQDGIIDSVKRELKEYKAKLNDKTSENADLAQKMKDLEKSSKLLILQKDEQLAALKKIVADLEEKNKALTTPENMIDDFEDKNKVFTEEMAEQQKNIEGNVDVISNLQSKIETALHSAEYDETNAKWNAPQIETENSAESPVDHQMKKQADAIAELNRESEYLTRSGKPKDHQGAPITLKWRTGATPQKIMKNGIAFGSEAYFSDGSQIYCYDVIEDKWEQVQPLSKHSDFAMAIVTGYLVTIGGEKPSGNFSTTKSRSLRSLLPDKLHKPVWRKVLPSMPMNRVKATAATTHTHLVVAGGTSDIIDVLDTKTYQWSSPKAQLLAANFIQLRVCCGRLYLLRSPSIFSCSLEELFRVRKGDCSFLWKQHAEIPQGVASTIITMKDSILAIGGKSADVIQRYDEALNSWSVIEVLPPRLNKAVTVVLSTNELIISDHLSLHIGTDIL